MGYIKLNTGGKIDKEFFETRLKELKSEQWDFREISLLPSSHVHCELTFETISLKHSTGYFESNEGSIVSVNAFEKYIENDPSGTTLGLNQK